MGVSKKLVVVTIPVYKQVLSTYEVMSLQQCFKLLRNYDIRLVAPEGLSLKNYEEAVGQPVNAEHFAPHFFDGIEGYDKLMLSTGFYKRFSSYEYLLIYQLDAFVLRDELTQWCRKGYDYIGAPWINVKWGNALFWYVVNNWNSIYRKVLYRLNPNRHYIVGNGGFSLRKISSHLRALQWFSKKAQYWELHEDCFWAHVFTDYPPFFKLPDKTTAALFSFEKARETLPLTKQLPFGCHAWYKHDLEFWRPVMKNHGFEV